MSTKEHKSDNTLREQERARAPHSWAHFPLHFAASLRQLLPLNSVRV